MKKAVLIFLSFFFITAIPAFADTSGGYGGTNVTVINASGGEVEIQNLQCSAYNSFQLRLSSGGSDLAGGATCSQNGSNADVTWSSYDFNAHGVVSNYIIAESFSTGTDWSNTFSYSPTGGTNGGYGGTNVSVINASSGEVEIQNLQCSAYNSFQLRISGNNNYGDLATGATCSQNGSNADVTWSSWDFNAHGAVSNYIIAESFTFGTDFSNAFSYHSYAGTNVTVINASSGEVEIQNLQCSAYQSFQLRLDSGGSDLATGATCSQNGSNADVTWSSYNFNAHGAISNYIVAESGLYGTDFSNTFSFTPTNNPPVINSISNATLNEGDTYSANGSFTDSDSTSWTATVDYGDGGGAHSLTLSGTNFSLSHVYSTHGTYTVTVNVTDNQGATGTGTATITVNAPVLEINSGGGTSGNFVVDTDASGGSTYTSSNSVDTSSVTNPAPQAVYQSVRYGNNFTYTIPNLTPNTNYLVKLHFNELYWGTSNSGNQGGVGSRVFNVSINGSQVLNNFDIFLTAGGADKALVKQFTKPADSNGNITIAFSTVTDNAMVNGIEIDTPSSATPPQVSSLALNSGGIGSGSFISDDDYSGGTTYSTTASVDTSGVTNPAPQSVYQTVRYGNMSYVIPNLIPNASYTVKLHFNELYWGTSLAGGNGGTGSRVFNVAINGTQVLNNFDIYQTAGGANKAIVEQFTTNADTNGKVTIDFTAVTDNALINGIELSH